MSSVIILLRSLLKTLRLHCCSQWFEQHPSRNAEWITESRVESQWVTSRHELVHGLRKEQQPQSVPWRSAHHQLLSVHSEISLHHCSKLRQSGRKTLHRGSRRVQRRCVCKYDRFWTSIMLHMSVWHNLATGSMTTINCSPSTQKFRYVIAQSLDKRGEKLCIAEVAVFEWGVYAVVKLLNKRWWVHIGARPEGPKLESEGPRAEVEFPTADQGFSSTQGTLFSFYGI